ncbi:lipase secretion chaperone [Piscinibacter sp. HJYY11]|uniref:lipase secretion chaperone n=1 Tax=Piscinibacter sp. HJYY11 TaxID=2801333 RepID=UPI00191EFF6B|nr:lipase secretion chaperone [Piscinibacter sp. HJYY11]MBL0729215.1 hypothetical protein [Piscinibacter sp. HJYY11]
MAVTVTATRTSFSTPFWGTVAGIAAVAAVVAHLSSPSPDAGRGSLADRLAAIDRHTPALADVAVPETDEDRPVSGTSIALRVEPRGRPTPAVATPDLSHVKEARQRYAAEVARILADPTLNEAQQQQRLLALRMSLPPEVAAQEFGGSEFSLAMEKLAAEMRARGESDDEVVFMRRQFVEVEGAKSVVELEREKLETERQAWALRHPGFIRERGQVYAADLSVPEKQERLEGLLQAHFKPHEREQARQLAGL